MAKIVGSLEPADDYTHPLGPEPTFNESMYFNFFDRRASIGGFVRIGNRANEGHAETTVTLFMPDGRVLFRFARPQIPNNDAMDAGGLRFEVIEPTQRLRTVFEGTAVELQEPRDMADPRAALAQNPRKKVAIDLIHDAVGPMYGNNVGDSALPVEQQFAKGHFEQHMHVAGSVEIDGKTLALEGYGMRDHSWGPRVWQAIDGYEWLTMNFGPDFGAMLSSIRRTGQDAVVGGVLVRGDELENVREATIEADYEPNGLYHTAVRARFRTQSGEEHSVTGSVQGFIPLRNRRDGRVTHIGEGMTEWRLGDRIGYGLSEFLRQIPAA